MAYVEGQIMRNIVIKMSLGGAPSATSGYRTKLWHR